MALFPGGPSLRGSVCAVLALQSGHQVQATVQTAALADPIRCLIWAQREATPRWLGGPVLHARALEAHPFCRRCPQNRPGPGLGRVVPACDCFSKAPGKRGATGRRLASLFLWGGRTSTLIGPRGWAEDEPNRCHMLFPTGHQAKQTLSTTGLCGAVASCLRAGVTRGGWGDTRGGWGDTCGGWGDTCGG